MAKLIHSLANTNRQNNLYYGDSSLCPICHEAEETMRHVLTCSHPLASQHHDKEMTTLFRVLQTTHTPQQIIETIQFGFNRWWSDPNSTEARPPTAGSLRGPDAVLTSAFLEQFCDIGWYHMCMGRISTKWALAAAQYNTLPNNPDAALHWASILIAALWRFSKSLWQH